MSLVSLHMTETGMKTKLLNEVYFRILLQIFYFKEKYSDSQYLEYSLK